MAVTLGSTLVRLREEPRSAAPSAAREPREVSVPQAMRPAVELIARLSAERSRLRDDLQRLRDELRPAEVPASREAALEAELVRVRAERDALRRELEALRAERARPVEPADPFAGLLQRLEKVASRLEHASRGDAASSTSRARRRASSDRAPRRAVDSGPQVAPAAPTGGGLLGALVKQNMALRPGSGRAARPATSTPNPAPQRRQDEPAARSGGGLLGALVKQNLAVRASKTPAAQPRAA